MAIALSETMFNRSVLYNAGGSAPQEGKFLKFSENKDFVQVQGASGGTNWVKCSEITVLDFVSESKSNKRQRLDG